MATQTGNCEIGSIEGTTVKGWFESVYEKNVYSGNAGWAAMFLRDAFQSLHGVKRDEAELRAAIREVVFDAPHTRSTRFTIVVSDPAVLVGLGTGAWESYYVG